MGKPKCTHYQGFQHSRRAKRSGDIPEQLLRYHGILVMSFRRQSGHTESGSTQTHTQASAGIQSEAHIAEPLSIVDYIRLQGTNVKHQPITTRTAVVEIDE